MYVNIDGVLQSCRLFIYNVRELGLAVVHTYVAMVKNVAALPQGKAWGYIHQTFVCKASGVSISIREKLAMANFGTYVGCYATMVHLCLRCVADGLVQECFCKFCRRYNVIELITVLSLSVWHGYNVFLRAK